LKVFKYILQFAAAFCLNPGFQLDHEDVFGGLELNFLEAVVWVFGAN
jgi:hypothetical protein